MKRNMLHITKERGSAGIKAIIAIAILVAIVYVAIKMIPIYADHYDVEDKIKEDILYAGQRFGSDIQKELTKTIYQYLDDIDAEYNKEKEVRVKVNKGTKLITVNVWYRRDHKIPFFRKQFELKIEGKFGL
mgnify:CR=1 FL=1